MYATDPFEGPSTTDMFEQHSKQLAQNFYRAIKPSKQELFYPRRMTKRHSPPKVISSKPANPVEFTCPPPIVPTPAEKMYLQRLQQHNRYTNHTVHPIKAKTSIVVKPVPVVESTLSTTQPTARHPLRAPVEAPRKPPSPVLKRTNATNATNDKRSILWDPLIPSRVSFTSSYGQIELIGAQPPPPPWNPLAPHDQILQSTENLLTTLTEKEDDWRNRIEEEQKILKETLSQIQVFKSKPITIETPAIETGNELVVLQLQCHQDQTAQIILYQVEKGKVVCSVHSTGKEQHSGGLYTLSFQIQDLCDENN